MTDRPEDAEGQSPFFALRAAAARQIELLDRVQEILAADPSLANCERCAKLLNASIKSARELFAADAAPLKSAEELKREDDAIRDEFARRLAAMLRGQEAGRAPGGDAALTSPEASS